MADLGGELRVAVDTGRVVFGTRQTRKALEGGQARMVIIARNCPDEYLRGQSQAPLREFPGSNLELGTVCGQPFSVSALAVLDPGKSSILKA